MDIILPGTGHCSSDRERRGYAVLTGKEDSSDKDRDVATRFLLERKIALTERETQFLLERNTVALRERYVF